MDFLIQSWELLSLITPMHIPMNVVPVLKNAAGSFTTLTFQLVASLLAMGIYHSILKCAPLLRQAIRKGRADSVWMRAYDANDFDSEDDFFLKGDR